MDQTQNIAYPRKLLYTTQPPSQTTDTAADTWTQNKTYTGPKQSLELSLRNNDIELAWAAYIGLRDLEKVVLRTQIIDDLHRTISENVIKEFLRSTKPSFRYTPHTLEEGAEEVYRYTKLLNYLLLVSKSHTSERNNIAVLKLTMGQVIRRCIPEKSLRTKNDARHIVNTLWGNKYTDRLSPSPFDVELLLLGAWKARCYLLVNELYSFAKARFRSAQWLSKISSIVLSIYARDLANATGVDVVRGIMEDLEVRGIGMSPYHYPMLVFYFGKVGMIDEAVRIFEQALGDPEASSTEALYYNLFRALGIAYKRQTGPSPKKEGYVGSPPEEGEVEAGEGPGKELAQLCMRGFQLMLDKGVSVSYKTYQELMFSMIAFGMNDKADKIFKFAVKNQTVEQIKPHMVKVYLQGISRSPHEMQVILRQYLTSLPELLLAFRGYPKRVLIDQFGIFNGDLDGFITRAKRGHVNSMLTDYLSGINKAQRAALFITCMLAGNDKRGRFKGFNFPKLGENLDGVQSVEREVYLACQWISDNRSWLRHWLVVHCLLPVIAGIKISNYIPDLLFIQHLANAPDIRAFVDLLDEARIPGYSIEIVNQFLRVRFLKLTYQEYVRGKQRWRNFYANGDSVPEIPYSEFNWPLFLYGQSSNVEAGRLLDNTLAAARAAGHVDKDATGASNSKAEGRFAGDEIRTSWEFLISHQRAQGRLAANSQTIAIFSLVSIKTQDWEFGRAMWQDIFDMIKSDSSLAKWYQGVFVDYIEFLAASKGFNDEGLSSTLEAMHGSGVEPSSIFVCLAIRRAFELGQLSVATVLEQWQRFREQRLGADPGFLREYFARRPLPELPSDATSVMRLVDGDSQCPRLAGFVAARMREALGKVE